MQNALNLVLKLYTQFFNIVNPFYILFVCKYNFKKGQNSVNAFLYLKNE